MTSSRKSRFLAITSLASISTFAVAQPPGHDINKASAVLDSGTYQATAVANKKSATAPADSIPMLDSQISTILDQFSKYLNGKYWDMRTKLNSKLQSEINTLPKPWPVTGYEFIDGGMNGDLSISATGNSNGTIRVTESGLNYSTNLKLKTDLGNCGIGISLTNIKVDLNYDPYTGAMTSPTGAGNANISYGAYGSSVECETVFDIIPFIGSSINDFASSYVGGLINSSLKIYAGSVDLGPVGLAPLKFVDGIQSNLYMNSGIDVGAYLKNNISNLYAGKKVTAFLANPYKYVPKDIVWNPDTTNIETMRTSVNNSLEFSVEFFTPNSTTADYAFYIRSNKIYRWNPYVIFGGSGPAP